MIRTITRGVDVERSVRVMQAESLFDIPPAERSEIAWDVHLPIEEHEWSVGLIVGPSGAGKSTVARECFGDAVYGEPEWDARSLLDNFPEDMPTNDVTDLLLAVGLGSVPAWVRPYSTLSTGEQFRARVARALAERTELVVVDEWTSTVDRQVGRVTSAAAAKAVRRRGQRLVAVTCHYDVLDWLQPDWVYQPHADEFSWRSVLPRPQIQLDIAPIDRAAWRVFRQHHYLSGVLPPGQCFGGFVDGECVAFAGFTHVPHPSPKTRNLRRLARVVVLPDWQGIGIGGRFTDACATQIASRDLRVRILTAHPGMVRHLRRSPRWRNIASGEAAQRLRNIENARAGREAHVDQLRTTFAQTRWVAVGPNAERALANAARNLRRLNVQTFEFQLPQAPGEQLERPPEEDRAIRDARGDGSTGAGSGRRGTTSSRVDAAARRAIARHRG